jgi:hypothetical protein
VVATHSYVHDGNRCRKIRDLNKLNVEDALAIVEIEAMSSKSLAAAQVDRKIVLSRGERVMLDADLAALYEVETRSLVQAVRRNAERFPSDFMFQLTAEETAILRSQTGISSSYGGRRYLPYVFTEQGVAMLSSVLRSPRAIAVNIEIMRTFVRLRAMLATHADLAAAEPSEERSSGCTESSNRKWSNDYRRGGMATADVTRSHDRWPGMDVCRGLAMERPPRPWSEQVLPYGLAAMMLITPSGWTPTEATREVRLPR